MKENKYDEERFFERYSSMARSREGLRGAGEWHILRGLLPDFRGKNVLDLGCGFGWHCMYAVEHGASHVAGIDISRNMIEGALVRNPSPKIDYKCTAIEDYVYPAAAFDIVLSSLAFHYLHSFRNICGKVAHTLKKGGAFVFSVEHPVFTAYGTEDWIYGADEKPLYWPVDRYFSEGERETVFLGEKVVKYHRTLTTYLNSLLAEGFEIRGIVEPTPAPETLREVEGMEDELRRPMMLIVSSVLR